MFWTGVAVGLFIGVILGVLVEAILASAHGGEWE